MNSIPIPRNCRNRYAVPLSPYFGATTSEMLEDDWFFFWRVFGSMMGLGPERLHDNLKKAQERMKFLHTQCPMPPTALSCKLLEVHRKTALEDDDADIKYACKRGWISKKMEQYLTHVGKWPKGLKRTGEEV